MIVLSTWQQIFFFFSFNYQIVSQINSTFWCNGSKCLSGSGSDVRICEWFDSKLHLVFGPLHTLKLTMIRANKTIMMTATSTPMLSNVAWAVQVFFVFFGSSFACKSISRILLLLPAASWLPSALPPLPSVSSQDPPQIRLSQHLSPSWSEMLLSVMKFATF